MEAEVNKLTQQAQKKKLEKDKSSIYKELREREIRTLNLSVIMYSTGGRGRWKLKLKLFEEKNRRLKIS